MLNQQERYQEMASGRRIKTLQKTIRRTHPSEDGSVLLLALGLIVLLFVVITAIFYFALSTQKMIVQSDRYTKLKDAKSYAVEESKARLTTLFDKEITKILEDAHDKGKDSVLAQNINRLISTLSSSSASGQMTKPFFSSKLFGASKQYRFDVGIVDQVKVDVTAAYSGAETGGWSGTKPRDQEARQIKVPVNIVVVEEKESQKIKHNVSTQFVYEVQWENESRTPTSQETQPLVFGQLDAWRNIFYPHYTNAENNMLSADTWARLLYRGYKYQSKNQVSFSETKYNQTSADTYRFGDEKNKSVVDTKLTKTTTVTRQLSKNLIGEGSIIIKDVDLKSTSKKTVSADNMVAIINDDSSSDTEILNIDLTAATGMFLSSFNQKTRINSSQITTPSWLISQKRRGKNIKEAALVLDNATVKLDTAPTKFDYNRYLKTSTWPNPQLDKQWGDVLKGGLIIGSSVVDLRNGTSITLGPQSNFMLTSAAIDESIGEESFSYHNRVGVVIGATLPNLPSVLKIGKGARIIQAPSALSFIDVSKKSRRVSNSENSTQPKESWLDVSNERNRIEIASGGKLALGITGIEPFDLILEKDAEFSFYVTRDITLFDPTFIKEGKIAGKLIIYAEAGGTELLECLKQSGINYDLATDATNARNGKVTVVTKNGNNREAFNVVRTFSYLVDVDFMKKNKN